MNDSVTYGTERRPTERVRIHKCTSFGSPERSSHTTQTRWLLLRNNVDHQREYQSQNEEYDRYRENHRNKTTAKRPMQVFDDLFVGLKAPAGAARVARRRLVEDQVLIGNSQLFEKLPVTFPVWL